MSAIEILKVIGVVFVALSLVSFVTVWLMCKHAPEIPNPPEDHL